jgi:hypothetical protein
VRLNILQLLMVLLLCSLTVSAFSQNDSPQPTGGNEELFHCGGWARATTKFDSIQDLDNWLKGQQNESATDEPVQVAETVKLPYLKGLQYGYLTALEDVYLLLRRKLGHDPDKELPPGWSTLLTPRSGLTWANFESAIDAFCSNADHADEDVAEAAITILNEAAARPAEFGPDQRSAFFLGYGCSQHQEQPRSWFVVGYRDGEHFFWSLLRKVGLTAQEPYWERFIAGSNTHEFDLPPDKKLDHEIGTFCADPRNKNVPFAFAARAAALQARGESEDAESMLRPFYCNDLPTIWVNGLQGKGKACLGVIVFLLTKPVLQKPFSYMVGIINASQQNIEVDWPQWALVGKGEKKEKLTPALDPNKVSRSIERRSTIAASLAAFGASMSASAPQRAVITGPQGTSTMTIYPQPGQESAAASEAAASTARPGMEIASTLSDSSLRRTTLFPSGQIGGMVYFPKPKDKDDLLLEVRIPGLPKVSFPVNAK